MEKIELSRWRLVSVVSTFMLAVAMVLGGSLPANAWGFSNYAAYHGLSQLQTSNYPFPFVLTLHDNIHGPNYVSVQIRTSVGAGVAGPKVAGTGTVSYQAGTTYYGQVGGKHQGSSSISGKFDS